MSERVSIKPEETWALLVAVESYPQRPGIDLNGPFPDVCNFARWLRASDVPAAHITILASPLDENKDQCLELQGEGVQCLIDKPVTEEAFEEALKQFRNKRGMLVVFWSGHGIRTADGVRRALLGNYSDADKHNLNLESLQRHLRSDTYAYPAEQALIFDVCGTRFDELSHGQSLPDKQEPNYPEAPDCRQFVLFASEDGQVAENVSQERTGLFYRELRVILMAQALWPPNLEVVHQQLKSRFKKLQDDGLAVQSPIRYHWEAPSGERDEFDLVKPPPRAPIWTSRAQARLIAAFFLLGGVTLVIPNFGASKNNQEVPATKTPIPKPPLRDEPNSLAGTVIDAVTRDPLPGVTVTIQDLVDRDGQTPTTQTDHAGIFRFRNLPPGPKKQVRVHASRVGYELSRTDPWLGTDRHNVALQPQAR
jgi:hypothetical protein